MNQSICPNCEPYGRIFTFAWKTEPGVEARVTEQVKQFWHSIVPGQVGINHCLNCAYEWFLTPSHRMVPVETDGLKEFIRQMQEEDNSLRPEHKKIIKEIGLYSGYTPCQCMLANGNNYEKCLIFVTTVWESCVVRQLPLVGFSQIKQIDHSRYTVPLDIFQSTQKSGEFAMGVGFPVIVASKKNPQEKFLIGEEHYFFDEQGVVGNELMRIGVSNKRVKPGGYDPDVVTVVACP